MRPGHECSCVAFLVERCCNLYNTGGSHAEARLSLGLLFMAAPQLIGTVC